MDSPMKHGCCSQTSEQTPTGSDTQHDPDACPHKVLKESQTAALKDANAAHYTWISLPTLIAILDYSDFEPSIQAGPRINLATTSHAPPRPLSQVYCIYRI